MRPSGGTLTVLFTDLVSSTELLQRLGDDAADRVRRAHFRIVRAAVAAHGGHEGKTMGDGLMVVFQSASDAVSGAVAVQQGVYAHNQVEASSVQLAVRAGLEAGEPIRNEGDYFGTPVVVAKRLCDTADGGQIVVSETVRRLVGSRAGHTFADLGDRSLKGFSEAVPICEVQWEPPAEQLSQSPASPEVSSTGPRLRVEPASFVGRGTEFQQLEQCWASVRNGQRRLILLSGDAGIGKTRLASEFAFQCEQRGSEVLFGRADESSRTPCQPIVDALEQQALWRSASDLRAVLGPAYEEMKNAIELAHEIGRATTSRTALDNDQSHERLIRLLASIFTAALFPDGAVLVLDDLHWTDEATLHVLRRMMRQSQQSKLLIIGTFRQTDVSHDHPLGLLLTDLRRERLVYHIQLTGLDERYVGSLVAAWAGQDSPPDLTRAVYEQTEGNPLFVEEILRHLAETGQIFDEDGRLRNRALVAGVPEGVKDIISQRLARLSDRCNSVLSIASVIGRDFGLDALQRASGLSDDELIEVLDEAAGASLVSEVGVAVGRYRFAHALVHEALYENLTTTRRVRLHGQTLQYADNEGVKLAYEVLGSAGPTVIALGVSNCPAVRTRNWTTTQRWQQAARICRVILYDRRGVGMSSTPDRGYSMFVGVEDIRAVLDAAGIERAILWGATDGGPMAIAFAAHYPERVAGLLLLGTTAKYVASDDYPYGVAEEAVASFLRASEVDRGRAVSGLSSIRQGGTAGGEAPRAIAEVLQRVPRECWRKLVLGVGAADARSLLVDVEAPTLIIHDPENEYIPVQASHYLHERISGSRLLITEEWGRPLLGEEVWRTIDQFCQELVV